MDPTVHPRNAHVWNDEAALCNDRAVNGGHGFHKVRQHRSPIYMGFFSLSEYILRFPDRVLAKYLKSTRTSGESKR